MAKENKFKWKIHVNSIDALHRLHLILAYHLMDVDDSFLESIVLEFTLSEENDHEAEIHENIKEFVDIRNSTSTLTILSEGEEPAVFSFPLKTINDVDGYIGSKDVVFGDNNENVPRFSDVKGK